MRNVKGAACRDEPTENYYPTLKFPSAFRSLSAHCVLIHPQSSVNLVADFLRNSPDEPILHCQCCSMSGGCVNSHVFAKIFNTTTL